MTASNDVIVYICGETFTDNFILLALLVKIGMKSKIPLLLFYWEESLIISSNNS